MSSDVYEVKKEVESEKKVQEIEYYRPSFWKRIFLIFFDALICFFLCFASFNAIKAIVNNYTVIKDQTIRLNEIKLATSLYVESENQIIDIVSYYDSVDDVSYGAKEVYLKRDIDSFFTFLSENCGENVKKEALAYYDEYRLDTSILYENKPYFIEKDGEVVKNEEAKIPSKAYVENIYSPFIVGYCQGLLNTKLPEYISLQKSLSNVLFFVEIPISVFLGVLIVYYIIPLCLRRGRLTLGRLLFKTGLVNQKVLNVDWKTFTLRFVIFFFAEIVLSVFTLCIPLIISLSMMAFSKKKQTFHDYMLGIEEVDTQNSKIYFSLNEVAKPIGDSDIEKFKMK